MEGDSVWSPSSSHRRSLSHSRYLGSLWTALNSLETALRLALCQIEETPNLMGRVNAIFEAEVGQVVGDDKFTRQLQLHELIKMFNEHAELHGIQCVEPEIGEVRHALAHGRVTSVSEDHDIRLVNFKRQKGGALFVCYSATLTPAWFKKQRKRILEAIECVHASCKTLPSPPQREVIVVGNVAKKDVSRAVLSEDLTDTNLAHRLLVIVGGNMTQGEFDELRERFERVAKFVRC